MLSKDLRKLSVLSRRYLKENKTGIIDILLFGSAAKGKMRPTDLDIALIAKKPSVRSELTSAFSAALSKNGFTAHVSTLFVDDIFSETLWSTVIHEGVSLVSGEYLAHSWGYSPQTLFEFDASKMPKSKRVRFQYALVGRDGNGGIVASTSGKKIGNSALIVPVSAESEVMSFFDLWEAPYKIKRLLAE